MLPVPFYISRQPQQEVGIDCRVAGEVLIERQVGRLCPEHLEMDRLLAQARPPIALDDSIDSRFEALDRVHDEVR